jgi:MGT family glycosyltransferase
MTNFLFASFPVTGHMNPGLPIARELVARGHDVRWYSTHRFKRAIECTGARFIPFRRATPIDETRLAELYPERAKSGLAQIQWDVKHVFIDAVRGQFADLVEELEREPADVIVGDNASVAAATIQERFGLPWAVYGVTVPGFSSRDTAPFGLALMPSSSPLGRLRNRALTWLNDNVIFGAAAEHFRALRAELGLSRYDGGVFDFVRGADLILQGSVASFEYPRTDMPPQLRFIGATIPPVPSDWTPPSWWHELDGRQVVLVTQGTIATDYDQLIRPAIRALANEDVFVVVTTGNRPAADVAIDPLPANVRIERFVPYARLMPKVDVLVTNGGYGSVQIALAHGVPIVAFGKTEEKPELVNRINWSRVGVGMKVLQPTETQIRDAVTRVLTNPSYAIRAASIRHEMSGLNAPVRAADLLEELVEQESFAASA